MTWTFARVDPFEVAWGWVPGVVRPNEPPPRALGDPVEALEGTVTAHLERPPCYVAFSGGRDSSAVLAVAVRAARRQGLDPPVPITVLHDDVPETHESVWQERVIRHLGVEDWIRVSVGEDADVLGPAAQASLRQRGLLWPPTVHTKGPLFEAARGGSLLTGNGGDEILGAQRATPLARLIGCGPLAAGRSTRRAALVALGPRRLRRLWWVRREQVRLGRPWLREPAARPLVEALLNDLLDQPLDARRAIQRVPWWRSWDIGLHNLQMVAAEHDVRYENPLLHPSFLASVAHRAGRLGFGDRTEGMRAVIGGILPAEVLARREKVYFNGAAVNHHSRSFAETWDGSGVDQALVDPDRLRQAWLSDPAPATSMVLLHAAWLSADRQRVS